jgi:ribonucleoside-diphosphate reductase alpha chain
LFSQSKTPLASIYDSLKYQALIHQSGGGTGFSFSHIRPHDDRVASSSGVASGPISFIRLFNLSTDVIKQGGTRRGANMGILRVDHPGILDFIALKMTPNEMTNFNLSVGVTDSFMLALARGRNVALINPHTNKPARRLPARLIFDRLVEAAWATGEPGLVFLDTINPTNPTSHLGTIKSINPCGEQPLLAYESCTLGSINVGKFIAGQDTQPTIDFARLADTISLAVRFLDNVIDRNRYPLPEIDRLTKHTRKIGLGIMGFADLLIALNIPYNSEAALHTATTLMEFFQSRAHVASAAWPRNVDPFQPIEVAGSSRFTGGIEMPPSPLSHRLAASASSPAARLVLNHYMVCRKSAASWTASCSLRFIRHSSGGHGNSVLISTHFDPTCQRTRPFNISTYNPCPRRVASAICHGTRCLTGTSCAHASGVSAI